MSPPPLAALETYLVLSRRVLQHHRAQFRRLPMYRHFAHAVSLLARALPAPSPAAAPEAAGPPAAWSGASAAPLVRALRALGRSADAAGQLVAQTFHMRVALLVLVLSAELARLVGVLLHGATAWAARA
jgi:hypothetical protein